MDLHIGGPQPSADEREAVDALLGPDDAGRVFAGGPRAQRRDLLLPALHALRSRFGWLPRGGLNHIARRLGIPPAELHGTASFYHLFSLEPRAPRAIAVCDDLACRLRGGRELLRALETQLGARSRGAVACSASPCLGLCERAPAALVSCAGEKPLERAVAPADPDALIAALDGSPDPHFSGLLASVPQSGRTELRLLARVGRVDPGSLEAYRAAGGYRALARALELGPEAVIREVAASRLMGRGGAAFPTARKWEAVARAPARPHWFVCNADESEPGTFKDRVLLEGDPFAVLEGMSIGAFAAGCERGFVYVRGEYPLAAHRIEHAIGAARTAGLLGPDILGSGFAFDVELRRGAGAYVCGEETALFNSIEGRRGEPRNKPPFPAEAGLFGCPTAVNNVETLAAIPAIVLEGGAAHARIGTPDSSGTKLFCVSGHVAVPGLYEVPFGGTLRALIALAGGVAGGRELGAVLLGGAAGTFVGPDKLDLPLTFEATRAAGVSLGSGVVLVLERGADVADLLARIAVFFRDESCGQCVPCRVGTVRQAEALERLCSNRSRGRPADEVALLREIGQAMRDASICGLGQTASSALESALANLDLFPDPQARP
jgi:NADH-quinone oxidoreductase subunit F